jgi:hypothetical protein
VNIVRETASASCRATWAKTALSKQPAARKRRKVRRERGNSEEKREMREEWEKLSFLFSLPSFLYSATPIAAVLQKMATATEAE